MQTSNVNDNVNWLMIRSSMIAKQRLLKLADEYDLSPMQALTLCALEPDRPIAMSKISEMLTCDPSNVTGIIERLFHGDYISRRESSIDRRVKAIALTDNGLELREKLLDGISEHDAPNLEQLSADEILTLKNILKKTIPTAPSVKQHA